MTRFNEVVTFHFITFMLCGLTLIKISFFLIYTYFNFFTFKAPSCAAVGNNIIHYDHEGQNTDLGIHNIFTDECDL